MQTRHRCWIVQASTGAPSTSRALRGPRVSDQSDPAPPVRSDRFARLIQAGRKITVAELLTVACRSRLSS